MGEQVNTRFTSKLTQNGSDEVNTGNTSTNDSGFWNLGNEDKSDDKDNSGFYDNEDRQKFGTTGQIFLYIFLGLFAVAVILGVVSYLRKGSNTTKPKFTVKGNPGTIAHTIGKTIERYRIGNVDYYPS